VLRICTGLSESCFILTLWRRWRSCGKQSYPRCYTCLILIPSMHDAQPLYLDKKQLYILTLGKKGGDKLSIRVVSYIHPTIRVIYELYYPIFCVGRRKDGCKEATGEDVWPYALRFQRWDGRGCLSTYSRCYIFCVVDQRCMRIHNAEASHTYEQVNQLAGIEIIL